MQLLCEVTKKYKEQRNISKAAKKKVILKGITDQKAGISNSDHKLVIFYRQYAERE